MKKILDACPNETELYVGIKNCVGDRDVAEKKIIFGGNKTE